MPVLWLQIDGHPAEVIEPKLSLLDAGIVVLLDDAGHWHLRLSAKYRDGGREIAIPGGAMDEKLTALVRRFVAGETGDLMAEPLHK